MTEAETKALFRRFAGPIKDFFGLGEWEVEVGLARIDSRGGFATTMTTHMSTPYLQAEIIVDPDRVLSADSFIQALIHEFLHILLAPYDMVRNVVGTLPGGESETVAEVWRHAEEQVCQRLSRTLLPVVKRECGPRGGRRLRPKRNKESR